MQLSSRRFPRHRSRAATAALGVLSLGAGLVVAASPAATAATATAPTVVGGVGSCTTSTGALVGVDFAHWGGPIVRGCDPEPTTGIALLHAAKFTTAGTQHDGPAFICRIGNPKFKSGTQYPTPATEKCDATPPASAYWAYWVAAKGKNTWTYSSYGAYADHPANGEVQAWTFGATNIAGTTGRPTFTPNQVRTGLPTASAAPHRTVVRAAATGNRAAATGNADLAAGTKYLVDNLVGGTHYEPFGGGFADFGLTMDGALALIAAGTQDAAVHRIVNFLGTDAHDGSGRDVDDYTGIGTSTVYGGALGKEALTVEAAGYNPRAFGHHNLITALDRAVCVTKSDSCVAAGAYQNSPSTFSQALGVLGQLRAADTNGAAAPTAYLLAQQLRSGAFPSQVGDTRAADAETDSTAMAVMALALVDSDTARRAVARGLAWLAAQQGREGGFPGASGDSTNSAALAAQALRLDARRYARAIAKAESFLAAAQQSDGGFDVFAGDTNGSDVRASTQAVGGVVGTPFGTELDNLAAGSAARGGASYLVGQLTNGNHYETTYSGTSYPDQGLTADGVFALLAAGGHAPAVARMTSWLRGQVENYADPQGAFGGPYSGGLAKLALVAESTGGDPTAFGGYDLIDLLTSHVCTKQTADGSCTAKGDFASAYSTVSQALGVLALQAAPDASVHLSYASAPVGRLLQLQCADGGFSSTLITGNAKCSSDVDTTGYAVQALAAVAGNDRAIGRAQRYLQSVQGGSGRYSGAAGANSNSTALASQALQTLTAAGIAATPDRSTPRTVAPVTAWQSALRGLSALAVSGGGFGVSSNRTADVRASTQAVAAAARGTLLGLSGAAIASTPRLAAADVEATTHSAAGCATCASTTSKTTVTATSRSADPLADTGPATRAQLGWALALLLLGAGLLLAGRPLTAGRHRAGAR